ncbi:AAA family ATPase [Candidatus Woesearchaeota archaeon]|jgi:DNA repair protein SbcC/Rad50|nr:AAA family ATPase [Candidatus Woesearchaeota archaeon]MBT4368581.1 AAA family ATPase [Candidatus Woesearchaeota archaeon]MBT4713110.1 AAA family ATPase [Candidatus Woesearchaeota archaeon]MBT6639032.1 AAA family ATPase [Candidatus Woesearchaeota archaeon]MBT7134231.1 AAA family ATPase [Candidatus Woesearchaeota archaeon]
MLIKTLKLNNIRTYLDETIIFPDSSIMLSGDIGCGKSSILLAIEFALFGILRGELSGESLLRKGSTEGSVELEFQINELPLTIKRTLKRSPKGVQQSAGFFIENGIKTEATAIELKTKILTLLGYPQSLLTTSKSLIYRYTVYTPQEEMKRIIQDDEESRLNILRKVFNMDKYKRIKENASTFLLTLRDELLIDDTKLQSLFDKQRDLAETSLQLKQVDEHLKLSSPKEEVIVAEKKLKIQKINEIETHLVELNKLKQTLSIQETNLKNIEIKISANINKIFETKNKKETLELELAQTKLDDEEELKSKILALTTVLANLEQKERDVIAKTFSFKEKIKEAEQLSEKIAQLKNCPLCLQPVNDLHKKLVSEEEQKKIAEFKQQIELLNKEPSNAEEKKVQLDEFKRSLNKIELINFKKKTLDEYILTIKELESENLESKTKIESINQVKSELVSKIAGFAQLEEQYKKIKQQYLEVLESEKSLHVKLAELKTKKEAYFITTKKLETEIDYLLKLQQEVKKRRALQNWIKEHFLKVVDLIERHVMLKIQQEFNGFFQEWFNFMLEDENISARLDEKFSPIVTQNGYEIAFGDLSGGEKTSVALAYRLALNKVINDLISTVNTKDIIVLDEPTDGFSSEQLDKLKDVLDQLNMNQVILVSHESKVESFVGSVIRITKNAGVSKVLV